MTMADIDLDRRIAIVRRGKGGRGRIVPFSPQCAAALDDYLRARRRHPRAKLGSEALWLGESGRAFGYWALSSDLTRQGELAGIRDMHPHRLRHTAAIRFEGRGRLAGRDHGDRRLDEPGHAAAVREGERGALGRRRGRPAGPRRHVSECGVRGSLKAADLRSCIYAMASRCMHALFHSVMHSYSQAESRNHGEPRAATIHHGPAVSGYR
jgi:integrase